MTSVLHATYCNYDCDILYLWGGLYESSVLSLIKEEVTFYIIYPLRRMGEGKAFHSGVLLVVIIDLTCCPC